MVSIHTNTQALAALATLRSNESAVNGTEARVTTGMRVASATDNAAYWSIATTMRNDAKAAAAVRDSLSLSMAVVDTAYAASEAVLGSLDELMNIFVNGRSATEEQLKVYDKQIQQLDETIIQTVKSASFNGINLLYHATGATYTQKLLGSVTRGQDGSLTVNSIPIDLTQTVLIDEVTTSGILTKTYNDRFGFTTGRKLLKAYGISSFPISFYANFSGSSPFNSGGIKANTDIIDQLTKATRDVFAQLGVLHERLALQLDFAEKAASIQKKGIGLLVDADMNEESARLRAEQTRQQLSTQSLHIANNAPSAMLQLYSS